MEESDYVKNLSVTSRKRYVEKVVLAGIRKDPYCLVEKEWEKNPADLPSLAWSDIMIYMISTPSPYTKEAIKVASSSMNNM